MDIAGQPTGAKQIAHEADKGAASPGTYGTAITSNTSMSFDSATTLTVVEGALVRAVVLDTAIERMFPGMSGVEMLMQEGGATYEQKLAVLQPQVNRLVSMCLETYETDHTALTSGLSNSVGDASPFTVNEFLSAIYTYDTLEAITTERAAFLWPVQLRDLKADLLVNGGGLGGAWANMDAAAVQTAQLPSNGFLDTFLKVPVYQGSHSLRTLSTTTTSNDTVNGAMIAIGRGDPTEGGQLGAFGHARSGWIKNRLQYSAGDRGIIVVTGIEYVAAELRDALGVRMKSKST